jgi:hypothetical protein
VGASPTGALIRLSFSSRFKDHIDGFLNRRLFHDSVKPRHATKPSKIRDVNFIVPARMPAAFLATFGNQGSVLYFEPINTGHGFFTRSRPRRIRLRGLNCCADDSGEAKMDWLKGDWPSSSATRATRLDVCLNPRTLFVGFFVARRRDRYRQKFHDTS